MNIKFDLLDFAALGRLWGVHSALPTPNTPPNPSHLQPTTVYRSLFAFLSVALRKRRVIFCQNLGRDSRSSSSPCGQVPIKNKMYNRSITCRLFSSMKRLEGYKLHKVYS